MSTRLVPEETLDPSALPFDESHAPASVRAQSAVVRTLVAALEQLALSSEAAAALREQLAEELARLGLRVEEAVALDRTRERE